MAWSDLAQRFAASTTDLLVVVVATVAIYLWVILCTRVLGLRSFAKMSAFDFAMTIATGSVIATVALGTVPLTGGMTAVAVLFGAQFGVAWLRRHAAVNRYLDNQPLLLLYEGRIIDEHLARARLTRGDLMGKLRAAGVCEVAAVRLVVLETTGDTSVITGSGPSTRHCSTGSSSARQQRTSHATGHDEAPRSRGFASPQPALCRA